MSTENNKAVVISYYQALRDADVDRMSQLRAQMFDRGDQKGVGHMSVNFERPASTLRKAPRKD